MGKCFYCDSKMRIEYKTAPLSVCCHCLNDIYNDKKRDIIFEICNDTIQKNENTYFSNFIKDKIGLWRHDPKNRIPLMCCKICEMPMKNIKDIFGCDINKCCHNIKRDCNLYLHSC